MSRRVRLLRRAIRRLRKPPTLVWLDYETMPVDQGVGGSNQIMLAIHRPGSNVIEYRVLGVDHASKSS